MAARRRHAARTSMRGGVLALALSFGVVVAGCSWSRLDDPSTSGADNGDTPAGEMRSVPTVPGSATSLPGDDVALAPEAPTVAVTTEVPGEPLPDPDGDVALPPLPDSPVVAACTRLAEVRAAQQFGTATTPATSEALGDPGCRLTSGTAVAEIHYLSETVIESEWFRRDAIEPVGDVTSDAVGVAVFAPTGSGEGAGYTIALVSRREGAVIAVRGTRDDRAAAVRLANIVEGST